MSLFLYTIMSNKRHKSHKGVSMFTKNISKKIKSIAYLTLGFGISLASLIQADYSSQSATAEPKIESSAKVVQDQDLLKKINDKISSGWFRRGYDHVIVRVNNGVVTLQGSVKTRDDKEKVEKEVRNLEGVKSLNSSLTIEEPSSKEDRNRKFRDTYKSPADDQLNKKIRDDVSKGWLWDSYKDITLNTSGAVVTLEGTVDSRSDEQKLITEIQKIEGVKAVKSNLRIKNR